MTPARLWPWVALAGAAGALVHFAPPPEGEVVAPVRRPPAAADAARPRAAAAATTPGADEVAAIVPRRPPDGDAARLWSTARPAPPEPASAPVRPPPAPPRAAAEVAPPPAPPQAPPLPFRLLGRYNDERRAGVVLLLDGQVSVVHAGDPVGDSYRVETIAGNTMVLTYLPLNLQQTMDIGVSQ